MSGQVINVDMEKGHSSPPSVLSFPNVKMSMEQRPGITSSCQLPSKALDGTLGCVSRELVRRQVAFAVSQSSNLVPITLLSTLLIKNIWEDRLTLQGLKCQTSLFLKPIPAQLQ